MAKISWASALLVAVGVAGGACSNSATGGQAHPVGYLSTPDAPLVAPINQYETSSTFQEKQEKSGYMPAAGTPLVAPDNQDETSDSTLQKQQKSGYFPSAGAPLVSPTTTGTH